MAIGRLGTGAGGVSLLKVVDRSPEMLLGIEATKEQFGKHWPDLHRTSEHWSRRQQTDLEAAELALIEPGTSKAEQEL